MKKRILIGFLGCMVSMLFFMTANQIHSESDKVLARVGESVLTQQDLEEVMKTYEKERNRKLFTMEEKKQLLNNMIKGTLLITEAEKIKLDERPEVKAKLKRFRNELLLQEYIRTQIIPNVMVTEEEVEAIIKENPNLLPKEQLLLKEILVKTEKEAEEIYGELKKGGDFSIIAVNKSSAPTGVNGGYVKKPVVRGDLPLPLEEVAFSLKKGEFSKPIQTEKGYYLLYLIDRKELSTEEKEKIKNKIKKDLQNKKTQASIEKRIEDLKKDTKVEVYYDQIQ